MFPVRFSLKQTDKCEEDKPDNEEEEEEENQK